MAAATDAKSKHTPAPVSASASAAAEPAAVSEYVARVRVKANCSGDDSFHLTIVLRDKRDKIPLRCEWYKTAENKPIGLDSGIIHFESIFALLGGGPDGISIMDGNATIEQVYGWLHAMPLPNTIEFIDFVDCTCDGSHYPRAVCDPARQFKTAGELYEWWGHRHHDTGAFVWHEYPDGVALHVEEVYGLHHDEDCEYHKQLEDDKARRQKHGVKWYRWRYTR